MLQVARLAPQLLGDSVDLVRDFVLSKLNEDGGFQNRTGESDLYYTVFGIESLIALHIDPPIERISPFLKSFGAGENLDLVHLTSLIRSWANLKIDFDKEQLREKFLSQLNKFRSSDGGYNTEKNASVGTGYAAFLVYGALQDLKVEVSNKQSLIHSLLELRVANGSFGMLKGQEEGATPTTAAACISLCDLGWRDFDMPIKWLWNQFNMKGGGFFAIPNAPMPDLLSTATALHTLVTLGEEVEKIQESCLDFVDSLWTNKGSFYGTWVDDSLDVEYTLYGLLTLGHLK